MAADIQQLGIAGLATAFLVTASELLRYLRGKASAKVSVPRSEFDVLKRQVERLDRNHRAFTERFDEDDLSNKVKTLRVHAKRRGWKIDELDGQEPGYVDSN